jgi:hypothetical protein
MLFLSLTLPVISYYLTYTIATKIYHKIREERKDTYNKSLYDILHNPWNSTWKKYRHIFDFLSYMYLIAVIISMKDLQTFSIILSMNYLFRIVSFSITILPCINEHVNLQITNNHLGYGHDLIPSGHTSMMLTSLYHLYETGVVVGMYYWVLKFLIFVIALGIIMTRCHYSIDIYTAWIFSPYFYYNIKDCLKYLFP